MNPSYHSYLKSIPDIISMADSPEIFNIVEWENRNKNDGETNEDDFDMYFDFQE